MDLSVSWCLHAGPRFDIHFSEMLDLCLGYELNLLANFTVIRWSVFLQTFHLHFELVHYHRHELQWGWEKKKEVKIKTYRSFARWECVLSFVFFLVSFGIQQKKVLESDLLMLLKQNKRKKRTKFTEIAFNVTEVRSFCWQRFCPQWKLVKLKCKTHGVDFHLHLTHHNLVPSTSADNFIRRLNCHTDVVSLLFFFCFCFSPSFKLLFHFLSHSLTLLSPVCRRRPKLEYIWSQMRTWKAFDVELF